MVFGAAGSRRGLRLGAMFVDEGVGWTAFRMARARAGIKWLVERSD